MTNLRVHAAAIAFTLVSVPVAAFAQEAPGASGEPAPFQLSLWETVQIIDASRPIHGFRLALPYARNSEVYGADIGIVNRIDGDLEGVQISFAGIVQGDMKGLQYNFLFSSVGGQVQGLQMSFVNLAGSVEGAQLGAVNFVTKDTTGALFAFVNWTEGAVTGAQLGTVNYAPSVKGFQLGIVNVTEHLHGVQIGLVNFAKNGFLPVFPIINAAL